MNTLIFVINLAIVALSGMVLSQEGVQKGSHLRMRRGAQAPAAGVPTSSPSPGVLFNSSNKAQNQTQNANASNQLTVPITFTGTFVGNLTANQLLNFLNTSLPTEETAASDAKSSTATEEATTSTTLPSITTTTPDRATETSKPQNDKADPYDFIHWIYIFSAVCFAILFGLGIYKGLKHLFKRLTRKNTVTDQPAPNSA